jgi:hypothetical protein
VPSAWRCSSTSPMTAGSATTAAPAPAAGCRAVEEAAAGAGQQRHWAAIDGYEVSARIELNARGLSTALPALALYRMRSWPIFFAPGGAALVAVWPTLRAKVRSLRIETLCPRGLWKRESGLSSGALTTE